MGTRLSVKEMNQLPISVRIDIYRKANVWEWPPELGEKPEGWDEMPNYRGKGETAGITKTDIIRPYMRAIDYRIPQELIFPEAHRYDSSQSILVHLVTLVLSVICALLGVAVTYMLIRLIVA